MRGTWGTLICDSWDLRHPPFWPTLPKQLQCGQSLTIRSHVLILAPNAGGPTQFRMGPPVTRQESVAFLFNPHAIERFVHEERRHQEEYYGQHVCEQRVFLRQRHD